MGNVDSKLKIFDKLAALKTMNDGYPSFKRSNSYSSINNSGDSSAFLSDILISLLGQEELKNICVELLTEKLDESEISIKNCLRNTLNEKLSVGSNPVIPDFLFAGININVKSIDFNGLLKTDPLSINGELLYNDNTSGLSSTDFNTFLFEAMQDTSEARWGHQVSSLDMFNITVNNDIITVKVNKSYKNKTLIDLNNEYIDKLDLFDSAKLINGIIDRMFGTVTSGDKNKEQLVNEAKLDSILKSFIDADDNAYIDDSYFTFTNNQLREFNETAENRGNKVMVLKDCGNYGSGVELETLSAITSNLKSTVDFIKKKDIISNGLNDLSDEASSGAGDNDKQAVKSSFFKNFTNSTAIGLNNAVITPKLLLIILLNSRVFDNTNIKTEPIDIIKDNKVIFKTISCACKDSILSLLLKIVIKEIIRLQTAQLANFAKEVAKNQLSTTLSLVGVPPDAIALIRRL